MLKFSSHRGRMDTPIFFSDLNWECSLISSSVSFSGLPGLVWLLGVPFYLLSVLFWNTVALQFSFCKFDLLIWSFLLQFWISNSRSSYLSCLWRCYSVLLMNVMPPTAAFVAVRWRSLIILSAYNERPPITRQNVTDKQRRGFYLFCPLSPDISWPQCSFQSH